MVGAIQTFGDFIHWHPHIHALVSEGMFFPDGTFIPLPKLTIEPFLKLWEHLIRYYGWYLNKQRGQRAKRGPAAPEGHVVSPRAPSAREARKRRAALTKQHFASGRFEVRMKIGTPEQPRPRLAVQRPR